MAEDKNEEKRPGEPAWVTDPEFQKQMMFHLYLQASDEGRALMAPLFEQFGLPSRSSWRSHRTSSLRRWLLQCLPSFCSKVPCTTRENARVSLGVSQIDQELGTHMVTVFFLALKDYQGLLKGIIEQLKAKDEEQSSS
jgi:hypothetical protein